MITFIYHDSVKKEIARLEKKYPSLQKEGFQRLELLLQQQFHPLTPQQVIGPAKLHRVTQNNIWTIWKVEMVVPKSGLRPNQFPRVWFAVQGHIIAFLCIAMHTENYQDNQISQLAFERMTDIL
jgi:hypothetical protein